MGQFGSPLMKQNLDFGPEDKYLIIRIPPNSLDLQVVGGGNQSLIDSLLLISGAQQAIVQQLIVKYAKEVHIINPFAPAQEFKLHGSDKGNDGQK